ncbi:PAS domain-containing sensor histidine kinase [Halobacterium wangiae]|uniref:PAS domain-containing sensor histidine kinase n=1 Tax=Halobacterium wangiae TaxID=2902623 RepID=UPI001E321DCD|nr:PAS domain S-box protein [Halobacterium wangiae]
MVRGTLQRHEAICEASPDSIVLVDDDGRITYANGRVEDMLGYDPAELLGEPIEVLVPEDARDSHVAQRDAYIADPETRPMGASLDLTARCADGSTIPVDVSLSPIRHDGEFEVMAVVRDTSEHDALEKKHQSILAAVPDAVVIADVATGEIVEANDRVTELTGYDPADLLGEPQTRLHPAGEAARYRELFGRHVTEQQAIFAEFPDGENVYVETRDGDRVPVEINARVFELENRELIAGVFRDVSARTEREHQLRELHAATRQLMEATDREEVARLVAEAADSILDFTSTVVRLVHNGRLRPLAVTEQARTDLGERPDYPLEGANPVSETYDRGEPRVFDDVRTVQDGYERGTARAAMYFPVGGHGVVSVVDSAVGAFEQSDEQLASILVANAETALDRLAYERELERQNERLDDFAGVVSHDLKNPLNVAQGWLSTVQEGGARENLERVADALDRMDAIIEDTLTLAQQGRTVADQELVDVSSLAGDCWRVVSTKEGQLELADDFQLRGDRDRLRHVFENLFRNAVEHGSTSPASNTRQDADAHGGEDVTVTVGRLDDGFYVADDGAGVPPDERDAVFEPGHTSEPGGTGFGLAIVDEIARAHGWSVSVTDSEAGGARFEFTNVELA